ncbi:MAG: putative membrane protein [Verrucomicrobia bacterium]|nr:MAG: putative membrane protein [Verrucomicrobiota bacterium]
MRAVLRPWQHEFMNGEHRSLVRGLSAGFAVVFVWSAVRPWHPADWLLENVLVAASLVLARWIYCRVPLSRLSWVLVFGFLMVHEIGAHYTYSEVPYREWWGVLTGQAVVPGRNHFDRLVHFSYGLLLARPLKELLSYRVAPVPRWAWAFSVDMILSTSVLYELFEWGAAEVFGGELGAAYLGTQGDPWDAHRDMALAGLGALMAAAVALLTRVRERRVAAG